MTLRGSKAFIVIVALILGAEMALTAIGFWNMTQRRGVPAGIAAQRLLLTQWLVLPFLPVDSRIRPYTGGGQRYLGELTYDSARWIELLSPDALLGVRLGPNITAFENGAIYVTNDEGFSSVGARNFHYGVAHPEGRFRIIVVGGSTVFGWGSITPEWNLPARLGSNLSRTASNFYEVINAGVPGYGSAQEYLRIETELMNYRPDLVIVYDGWNDESQAELTHSFLYPGSGGPELYEDAANPFRTANHLFIEQRFSASFSILGSMRMLAGNLSARVSSATHHTGIHWFIHGLTEHLMPKSEPKPLPPYDPGLVGRYEANLRRILNLADQHGVRVALFLQPIMWIDARSPTEEEVRTAAPDDRSILVRQEFYDDARQMFARLRDQRQRHGRVCIEDMSQTLKGATETIYGDSGHLLGRGNQLVADEMAKRLAACGVL